MAKLRNWNELAEGVLGMSKKSNNAGTTFVNLNSALDNLNSVKRGVGQLQDSLVDTSNQNLSAASSAQAAADAFNQDISTLILQSGRK